MVIDKMVQACELLSNEPGVAACVNEQKDLQDSVHSVKRFSSLCEG